ncbi:hypothetical protein N7532_000139 [Penicillium argentinense]|uniref:Maltose/galactoside acetyltransferase domain-containing protein n=1 Tax=Penicillium argentinense TaxID=1131581 RepID=A0A9W9KMC4_9EURO|nr:uncharacterized protein N7532_000139 [Penicillium argentinense]KAJ5112094.1 hypothetical protein N7532_000139 [Penicillium argentinense]
MTAVASAPVMDNHENGSDHSPSRFTAVNGRESTTAPKAPMNSERDISGQRELPTQETPGVQGPDHDRADSGPSPIPNNTNHKRKRSESGEQDVHRDSQSLSRGPLDRPIDGPPTSNGARSGSGSVSDIEPGHSVPASGHRSDTNEAPSSNGQWPEYDSQLISQAQRAQQFDPSDAHLADALQREAQGQERDLGTRLMPSAPGCSNNCIRGGFLCEGYTSRGMWQKPSSTKVPVPLQSKEGYPEISAQYLPEAPSHHDRPTGLADHIERKMRPSVAEEGDRTAQQSPCPPPPPPQQQQQQQSPASSHPPQVQPQPQQQQQYTTSPTGTHASWSKRGWASTAQPYVSEHLAKPDYREVPPVHEMSLREGSSKPEYAVVPPMRELPGPPKSNMAIFQGAEQCPLPPAAPIDTNSPQAKARMALNIEHQLSGRAVSNEETEKEKMIRGELYRPFDVQLVEERDRCKRALWRFNNACNPVNGLSSKEQNRLLKEVLVPPSDTVVTTPPGVPVPRSTGSIGQGAVVESPFTCNYGYNIHIGEDVMVSQGCQFVDDCIINIGAHTWIGPNVTLLSSMAHSSMQERKGTQSRYQGRPITIEEDCYLGAGCTLYPGVHLGRGAYIAPGEVVKTHIVAYGFQGYKPSYM